MRRYLQHCKSTASDRYRKWDALRSPRLVQNLSPLGRRRYPYALHPLQRGPPCISLAPALRGQAGVAEVSPVDVQPALRSPIRRGHFGAAMGKGGTRGLPLADAANSAQHLFQTGGLPDGEARSGAETTGSMYHCKSSRTTAAVGKGPVSCGNSVLTAPLGRRSGMSRSHGPPNSRRPSFADASSSMSSVTWA